MIYLLFSGGERSPAMDEVVIIENNKRLKIENDNLKKNVSARVHPETCVERQKVNVQEGQAEVIIMSDDSDPCDDDQNRLPATLTPSLNSSSLTSGEGKKWLQSNMKSHSETQKFVKQENGLHSESKRTPHSQSHDCINSKSSTNADEKLDELESVDKEDSAETVDVQGEAHVPSVKYNFDNPLMAINYIGEFKNSKENFTKGCKWLVNACT